MPVKLQFAVSRASLIFQKRFPDAVSQEKGESSTSIGWAPWTAHARRASCMTSSSIFNRAIFVYWVSQANVEPDDITSWWPFCGPRITAHDCSHGVETLRMNQL